MKTGLLTTLTALAAPAHAFWRMECPGRVGVAQIDPIVNPGAKAMHMHSIYGSSGFSKTSPFSELRAGSCTSCRVKQDKSAYWTPSLYFQDAATGKFTEVDEQGGLLAYYFLNHDNIKAFPGGFRMLAGNTTRRTFNGDPTQPDPDKSQWAADGITTQADLAERAVGFNCLNYAGTAEPTLARHYLPDKSYLDANCPNGIRIEMMFPSCWDGKNLDSANHQSHVAYPDLVMTGTCPDTHPVPLPGLMYETFFATNAFSGKSGRFVIANGDTTGFGYHGDFIAGWDQDTLQSAVDTCTNGSGRIDDCPVFDLIAKTTAQDCKLDEVDESLVAEDGELDELPGGVMITYANGTSEGGESGDSIKEVAAHVSSAIAGIFLGSETTTSAAIVSSSISFVSSVSPSPLAESVSTSSTASPVNIDAISVAAAEPPLPSTTTISFIPPVTTPMVSFSTAASVSVTTTTAPVPVSTTTSSTDPDAGKFFSTGWITGGDGVVTKICWDQVIVTETVTQMWEPSAVAYRP